MRHTQLSCAANCAVFPPSSSSIALVGVGCSTSDDDARPPQLGVKGDDEQAAEKLGFPSSATRNTVRVGGGDPASDAAGVAGALYPATGDSDRPTAVVLVDQDDWATGVAAAVLSGRPIGAPILLTDGKDLPPVTEDVLKRLDPKGSDLSRDAQVIRIGDDTARPDGFKTALIEGDNPFEPAAAIDRFFSAARANPSNDVVLYSADRASSRCQPRHGPPAPATLCCPCSRNTIPAPIVKALREHEQPNVFVLGPESVISEEGARPAQEEQARAVREPDRGTDGRRERDRVRPLREGRLRLGRLSCPATTSPSPAARARRTPWPPRPRSARAGSLRRCS